MIQQHIIDSINTNTIDISYLENKLNRYTLKLQEQIEYLLKRIDALEERLAKNGKK